MSEVSVRKLVLAEYYHTVWNEKRIEDIRRFVQPDFVAEIVAMENYEFIGPEGVEKLFNLFTNAVPDLHIEIQSMVEENDEVAIRYIATGNHVGIGHGSNPLRFLGCAWITFEGGHMVRSMTALDHQMILQMLGRPATLD